MQANNTSSQTNNATRMLVGVSVFFLLTMFPMGTYTTLLHMWPIGNPDLEARSKSLMAYAIVNNLHHLNNATNFILYIAFGSAYRKSLLEMFHCKTKSTQPPSTKNYSLSTVSQRVSKTDTLAK